MLEIDVSLLVQMANFFALLIILNIILYRPLRKVMEQRRGKISGLEREIEGLIKNANQKLEDFKAKLREANVRGNKERETLKSVGLAEEKQITSEVRSESEAHKSQVLSQIEQAASKAREELKGQVSVFASEITAKILGRGV